MPKKQTLVLSSTHLDSQGFMMTKEALESGLPYLNGARRVKLGVEHIRTFPPMGATMNGKVVKGNDGEHYLVGESVYFDHTEKIVLDDGTELIKECFKEDNKPFWESEVKEIDVMKVGTDPANFAEFSGYDALMSVLREDSEIAFEQSMIGRKSNLADPEFIITLTKTLVIALGLGATKIPEKIGEAVGADIIKFYKFISRSAVEMIKRTIPANRPKNFVIQYNHAKYAIELIVTTHSHDEVVSAVSKGKLKAINEKIDLLKNLKPEKIQFIFNEKKEWEFNYLLTVKGEAIGKEKAFKNRDDMYKKLLKNQK